MEISLKDIVKIIKKSLLFIVVTALIFAVGSFFITKFFIPKTYKSTVKLYVETNTDTTSSQYNPLSTYNYAAALVATYIQMLQTNNFYTSVSEAVESKFTATTLSNMITFKSIDNTEVFECSVTATTPAEAKIVADAVAKVAPTTIAHLNDNAKLKIVDDASLPTAPASPSTQRNVLIASVLGLLLALIIAFIREGLDVKIKYSEEMTSILALPILAAVPDFESVANSKKTRESR